MRFLHSTASKNLSSSSLKTLLLLSSSFCVLYLFLSVSVTRTTTSHSSSSSSTSSLPHQITSSDHREPTSLRHLVFGIASTSKTWQKRKEYLKLWWKSQQMRGCVFLETVPPALTKNNDSTGAADTLPPVCVSSDTSRFRYTYRGGLGSAIRVARVVSETVALYGNNNSNNGSDVHGGGGDVRWYVFGDDDTVFFPGNLVKTLSKYDHEQWFYIGTNSETHEQNDWFSFEMGYGGGGFAISSSLATVFAKTFDSCLVRYPHLYGSDGRIASCLAELGVALTHEPGFHQVDLRGNLFGLLASHPLRPLVSLHHLDSVEPIFPNMTTIHSLRHLFKAVEVDPARVLQQIVCYDQWFSWTVSISWGYAAQVFERNVLLPDLLPVQLTFKPWMRKANPHSYYYMFNTKKLSGDSCTRPTVFFLENVYSNTNGIESNYRRNISETCLERKGTSKKLERIRVRSSKMELDSRQLQAPRRHCCDVLPSSVGNLLDVAIRECGEEELIYMHS